ncbi:MAG: Fur family transcriptional regulator [Pseudomonadota bacterium]|jgi:Fe2+ or Zn2+ uptake regulation protein
MSLALSKTVTALLQGAKLRTTLRRAQILELFVTRPEWQASIDQIYAALTAQDIAVSYSDIYRVVRSLETGGLISRGWAPGKSVPLSVYALTCDQAPPHKLHQLVCTACAHLEEFHDEALQRELERVSTLYGFKLENIGPMTFSGRCSHCDGQPSKGRLQRRQAGRANAATATGAT